MGLYQQTLQEGHSPADVHAWLLGQPGAAEALKEGYSDQEVYEHLATMPQEEARSAPGESTSFLRPVEILGQHLASGLAGTLGLPGDLESAVFGGKSDPELGDLPNSDQVRGAFAKLGLMPSSSLTPQSSLERHLAGAGEGLGGVAPMLPLGGVEAVIPTALAGTAAGLGHEQAEHMGNESNPLDIGAGVLTGLAFGGGTTAAQRGVSALRGDLGEAGQAFKAAGLPLRSSALTSDNPLSLTTPFAPVAQTHGDIERALQETAGKLGSSTTLQDAGAYAQRQARDWLATTLPAKEAVAWGPVDRAIPAGAPTPLNNFSGALTSMTTKGGSLAALVSKLQPVLPAQLSKLLQNNLGQLNGTEPTWSDVRALRSAIGTAMTEPSIAQKAGPKNLSAMYSAITADLASTAKTHGAEDLFASANAESTRLHQFAENIGPKLGVAGKTPSPADEQVPEKVAANWLAPSALKRGGTDLATLNTELPDVTRELAAAHLSTLGNTTGNQTIGGNLLKSWTSMSPEAQSALFPPGARARLEALAQVASKLTPSAASSSGVNSLAGSIMSGAGAAAGAGIAHLLGHPVGIEGLEELTGGAVSAGGLAGAGKNYLASKAANSALLARYASGRRPILPLGRAQIPLAALLGARGGNDLEAPRAP